jgi:type VI secretion system protein ImpK
MPWGAESAWAQKTLLSVFHNETKGGEKFFIILDRMRDLPAENIDILELMYIFLSLGYEGKYRVVHRGRDLLEQLRDELFQIIRRHRGEYERTLSPCWQGLGKIRNTLTEHVPMWVVASIIGGIMLLSYSGLRYWMHESTNGVAKELTEISTTDFANKKISVQ